MHTWFDAQPDQKICEGLYYRCNPYKIVRTSVVKNWSIHKNTKEIYMFIVAK